MEKTKAILFQITTLPTRIQNYIVLGMATILELVSFRRRKKLGSGLFGVHEQLSDVGDEVDEPILQTDRGELILHYHGT